jgi:hypothetical protein
VDSPVGVDAALERVDDLAQLARVAVLQEQVDERVRVGVHQVGEGVRVGRVAGLGRPRLRHAELLEEHLLQLLGRAEVELVPEHLVGLLGKVLDAAAELAGEAGEQRGVDRHPVRLHAGEHLQGGDLDVGEHPGVALVEHVPQGVHGPAEEPGVGRHPGSLIRGHQLVGVRDRQLFGEIAEHEVRQRLVDAARPQQPAGQQGVEHQPAESETRRCEGLHLGLRVVHQLGRVGRQPLLEWREVRTSGDPGQSDGLGAAGEADREHPPA